MELGEAPGAAAKPKGRGRGKAKAAQDDKVVGLASKRRGRPPKPADPELAAQEQRDQEGRNAAGIEGRENVHLSFLLALQSYQEKMGKERMKWATRVQKARQAGVLVGSISALVKELKQGKHELRQQHNVMNQLRALVHLPHFEQVDLLMGERTEAQLAEEAREDGIQHCWRNGREADCPYDVAQPVGQAWVTGFREAEADARKLAGTG
jgi:ribosome modulation factor